MNKLRQSKPVSARSSGEDTGPMCSMTPGGEFELLRRLAAFQAQHRDTRDTAKIVAFALRLSTEFFRVREGCLAVVHPGRDEAEILSPTQPHLSWDTTLLAGFLRGQPVSVGQEVMLARVRRFGRTWGALAVRCAGANFGWDARQAFSKIGTATAELVQRIDDQRIRDVRSQIDQKILEQIGPKNLFYQILHGIRSLVGYDHSAALLTCDNEQLTLEVVGEQVAWQKAKSQRVGLKLSLARSDFDLLSRPAVYGFNRNGKGWHDWTDTQAMRLAELLDYNNDRLPASISTAEGAMLCAPLVTRYGAMGVLKVAARSAGSFGSYEADVISQFLPQVAIALQIMRRTESLQERMQAAERKQAMADLARGVAHDVNNALGSTLPLVQQLRADVASEAFNIATLRDDLQEVERSLQICRRIFGGMLSFARRATRNASAVDLYHAVDGTLAIFREGLQRRGVKVMIDVSADLPPVLGVQADIEQLLLNLIGNARDAMEQGGQLNIQAGCVENRIELSISDTGCGIPAEQMSSIQEPFFTTKPSGSGLGLSICRSIVSQLRGKLKIESNVGQGTVVRVTLPLDAERL